MGKLNLWGHRRGARGHQAVSALSPTIPPPAIVGIRFMFLLIGSTASGCCLLIVSLLCIGIIPLVVFRLGLQGN